MSANHLAVIFGPSVLQGVDPATEIQLIKETISVTIIKWVTQSITVVTPSSQPPPPPTLSPPQQVVRTMIERSDDVFVREAQPATQRIFVHKMPVSQLEEGEETFKLSKAKNVAR